MKRDDGPPKFDSDLPLGFAPQTKDKVPAAKERDPFLPPSITDDLPLPDHDPFLKSPEPDNEPGGLGLGHDVARPSGRAFRPDGTPVAPKRTVDVRKQLRKARAGRFVRWKLDPGREIALVVLFVAALLTIVVFGAGWKAQRFALLGADADATFWMESAQRFRYVRDIALGGEIPEVDVRMQAPDGYPTRSDTLLQERLYGAIVRLTGAPGAGDGAEGAIAESVRAISRLVSATAAVPLAILVLGLTRRRDAALVAAAAYAFALPVAERGTGAVIFREDVAVPVLLWHLAFLGMWCRRPRTADPGRPNPLNPVAALLSGVALAGALLLWKVVSFHLVLLAGLFATLLVFRRDEPRRLAVGWALLLLPSVGACYLPLHLDHDGFITSTPMLLAAGLGIALVGASTRRGSPWLWLVGGLAAAGAARFALPSGAGLAHAWETILAKIRFLDQKPADPSQLSFHARHYWTGNYFSPTLARLLRDWPLFLLGSIPGLVIAARWWVRNPAGADREPDKPPPTRLLEGDGPAVPLPPSGAHFVIWLVVAFGGAYLLFSKLQLFAAIAVATGVGLGFAAVRRFRRTLRAAIVVSIVLSAVYTRGWIPTFDRLALGADDAESRVIVFPPESMNALAEMVEAETGPDEPILASFVVSPFLLTYLDRPTVLHCFFEGDLLDRLERVVQARFGSEEELAAVAREYGARWYVHEAHHTLRTDPRMSQRYIANRMDWPADAAVMRMSFAPEQLQHFELVAEDGFFRLFRVRDEPRRGSARRGVPHTLWNRALFTSLFGDPLDPATRPDRADGLTPEDLLYIEQRAASLMRTAEASGPWEEKEWALQRASEVAPFLPAPHEELAALYRTRGRADRASRHSARAGVLRAALSGRRTLPEDAAPKPIPLHD